MTTMNKTLVHCERTGPPLGLFAREQDGTSLIEMAVVLPAFTLLLLGIFQFAMALTCYLSASYSIRTAARYAGMHSSTSLVPVSVTDIQNMVNSSLFIPGATTPTTTVTYYQFVGPATGNYVGDVVSVSISYSQTIQLPLYSKTFNVGSIVYRMVVN